MSEPTRCVCICHCHAGSGKAENPGCPVTAKNGGMCSECRGECRGQPPEPRCVGCGAVWDEAHERLAALREGGERP